MKRIQSVLLLLLATLVAVSTAYASDNNVEIEPICNLLSAASAVGCDPHNEPDNPEVHAMYFPKLDGYTSKPMRYLFSDEAPAKLIEYDDGTATLSGVLVKGSKEFRLFAKLSNIVSTPDYPKKELSSYCYVDKGGYIDPDSWTYYADMEGILTALDGSYYDGAVIAISNKGPAVQRGIGANGKDSEDGVAIWFKWEILHQSYENEFPPYNGAHADFNFDLSPCSSTCTGDISRALGDYCGQHGGGHAITSAFSGKLIFEDYPNAVLIEYDDGTALLAGRACKPDDSYWCFDVELHLNGRFDAADLYLHDDVGSPKKELKSGCYGEDSVDVHSWVYYEHAEGTMCGNGGEYDGVIVNIQLKENTPYPQKGYGANGKNVNYGFSMWFDYESDNYDIGTGKGDFNIDVVPCCDCGDAANECSSMSCIGGECVPTPIRDGESCTLDEGYDDGCYSASCYDGSCVPDTYSYEGNSCDPDEQYNYHCEEAVCSSGYCVVQPKDDGDCSDYFEYVPECQQPTCGEYGCELENMDDGIYCEIEKSYDQQCGQPQCQSGACKIVSINNADTCTPSGSYDEECQEATCYEGSCEVSNKDGPCSSDGNVCTEDVCSGGECVHDPIANDPETICDDDGQTCTKNICMDGVCDAVVIDGCENIIPEDKCDDVSSANPTLSSECFVGQNNIPHAMYFPIDSIKRFNFAPEPAAKLIQKLDGTATLTGLLINPDNTNQQFYLTAELYGWTPTSTEIKKELAYKCYHDEETYGIDVSDWIFYTGFEAYLNGLPGTAFEGAKIKLVRYGAPVQIGNGANNKNTLPGLSIWFKWEVITQSYPYEFPDGDGYHGDFNLELDTCVDCVSEPSPAYKDECAPITPGGYVIITPFTGKLVFPPNSSPSFSTSADGSAYFHATVSNPDWIFEVELLLSGLVNDPPNENSPRRELNEECYESGIIDDWVYYPYAFGTMTVIGGATGGTYEGEIFDITLHKEADDSDGPAPQMGYGANGKNVNYGFSMWFDYTPRDPEKMGAYLQPNVGQADINIDLTICDDPLPNPPPRFPDCPNMAELLEYARKYRKDKPYHVGGRQWYKTI